MSIIHVQQIKAAVVTLFGNSVDMSDKSTAPDHDQEAARVTRCLAAFIPYYFASADAKAAASVIDGPNDNGIDSIFYDQQDKVLYVVQSKWEADGNGSIADGDTLKFIAGFRDLINLRFSRFNKRFDKIKSTIEPCILDANTKFCLVVVTTGLQEIGSHSQQSIDDLLDEMNDPTGLVTFRYVKQGALHKLVSQEAKGNPIDVDVVLYEWGRVREPFAAYYGQIAADEAALWYTNHHSHLFVPNLRVFLGATDANGGIIKTATENPERLWYFNNGITAICDTIRKKPLGGDSRDSGIFECTNLQVVNGAQTIGSIYMAMTTDPAKIAKARLPIRIVSLENCPPNFSIDITKATNTQNKIELRDFAALDDNQQRLASELFLDGITYFYKSGESVLNPESSFDFSEAIVALACSKECSLAVQAKREVSRLWDDVSKYPYKALVNPSLSGRKLWRTVQIQRVIDDSLREPIAGLSGRDTMIPVHGNRVVSHVVFTRLSLASLQNADCDMKPLIAHARQLTSIAVREIAENVNNLYPESYLASLFKNRTKCEAVVRAMNKNPAASMSTIPPNGPGGARGDAVASPRSSLNPRTGRASGWCRRGPGWSRAAPPGTRPAPPAA